MRYLLVNHVIKPHPEHSPSMKDYKNEGLKQVEETIVLKNNVKSKDLINSTYVIDLQENKLIRAKYREAPDQEIINYYLNEYKDDLKKYGLEVAQEEKPKMNIKGKAEVAFVPNKEAK